MNTITENSNRTTHNETSQFVPPCVNISTTKDDYVLEVEMPGVKKDGVEISVEGNQLIITGRRLTEKPAGGELCYCESSPADFRRVFELDGTVDTTRITAEMNQGVLRVRLPKSERAKLRKIQIHD